jgi:hypothetical protein
MKRYSKSSLTFVAIMAIATMVYNSHHTPITNTVSNQGSTSTKAGPLNLYPDPKLTPGDVLTTDASKVCVKGYSKSVRNVSSSEKKQVYAEYNIPYPQPQGSNEVDHFISLELGGSNDIKNLWLEPANPTPGFHEKDKVEDYLHAQVCNGSMALVEAQKKISTDWYKVYLQITANH